MDGMGGDGVAERWIGWEVMGWMEGGWDGG